MNREKMPSRRALSFQICEREPRRKRELSKNLSLSLALSLSQGVQRGNKVEVEEDEARVPCARPRKNHRIME